MYKVSILGDVNSVYGFAAVGIETFVVEDGELALQKLKKIISSESYAIVFVTEKIYSEIESELRLYESQMLPAIIPIQGVGEDTSTGVRDLRKAVEKAVGSDIIFGKG